MHSSVNFCGLLLSTASFTGLNESEWSNSGTPA